MSRRAGRRALRWFLAAACVAGLISGDGLAELPNKNAKWVRVETENLVVLSNARGSKARELAERLERFRRVILRAVPNFEARPPIPSHIFLFKNEASLAPYTGRSPVRGYYRRSPYDNFIALNTRPEATTSAKGVNLWLNPSTYFPYHVLYHEFVHYLLGNNFTHVPNWLNEGLAQYYGTFTVKNERFQIGRALDGVVALLNNPDQFELDAGDENWIPMQRMFEAQKPDDSRLISSRRFYYQSWATVHYLLHSSSNRRAEFFSYFDRLQRGMPHALAFPRSFSIDHEQMLAEIKRYLRRDQLPYGWVDGALVDLEVDATVSELSREEVLSSLGVLLVHVAPERVAAARQHFRAALEIDPAHAAAHYGLALAEEFTGNTTDAVPFYDRAIALAPENHLYRLRRGHNRLAAVERAPPDETPARETTSRRLELARSDLMKSIELRGDIAQAHIELGRSYLVDSHGAAQGIPVLKQAWKMAPDRTAVPVALTALSLRSGNDELAGEVLGRALQMYPFRILDGLFAYGERRLRRNVADRSTDVAEIRGAFELVVRLRADEQALPAGSRWQDLAGRVQRIYRLAQLADVAAAIRENERTRAGALLEKLSAVEDSEAVSRLVRAYQAMLEADPASSAVP